MLLSLPISTSPPSSQEVNFSAAKTVKLWLGAHQGWTPWLLGMRTSLTSVSSAGLPSATRATWPVTARCTQVGEEQRGEAPSLPHYRYPKAESLTSLSPASRGKALSLLHLRSPL